MRLPKFNLFEAAIKEDNKEYDPSAHAKQLKERAEMNLRRYRAAQDRGDNYGIKYYELRIKLDDLDMEKMKIRTAIQQLKQKFKKI
jgi:hypothetical protein